MYITSFFKFNLSLHFLLISVVFSVLANPTHTTDPKFQACEPQNCGNGPNISYPFWIADQQESYCGHPDFIVTCNGKNPVLNISGDDYTIKDVFYNNNSFLLANTRASDFENTCPIPPTNFSLKGTPFSYSTGAHTDLYFFYHCAEYFDDQTYPVDCASNATSFSFAVFCVEILEHKNYSIGSCQSWVYALVETENIKQLLAMNFTDVLRKGFVLDWSEGNCSGCERSGGRCGSVKNEFICFCPDRTHSKTCDDGKKRNWKLMIAIVISAVGMETLLVICAYVVFSKAKKGPLYQSILFWRKSTITYDNVEAFFKSNGSFVPKRYSYSSIKKVTNSFKDKLGQGGFGVVYKGKLFDGCVVAVKLLKETKGNGEEFINEIASISRTCHVNIVSLLGYCFEGSKRALVYEYMPNGSLEKFIYSNKPQQTNNNLEWRTMHKITVGIARGLEYLHRGCTTRIFHFDIKPHNILLDEDFCPKLSDFGLAKLCPNKESISMLQVRGTIGYIAPEVFCRHFGRVSHKADIYSYGMLILHIVEGREKIDASVQDTSELYFPHSIYKKLECDGDLGFCGIESIEDEKVVRKMILVGLSCIQANPSNRPEINKVIEMLEGNLESLQVPPEPFLSFPSTSQTASFTIQVSEENESCEIESLQ